jgi:hydroxymethylbilane synthase
VSETLVIGTRGSALARAQSEWVARQVEAFAGEGLTVRLEIISTRGDRIQDRPLPEVGGKGLFTAELEAALREGSVDMAVHSLKDLPTEDADGLTVGCITRREDPADVLIGSTLAGLREGAVVGTGSARRAAFLLDARPDLEIRGIRGNVGTRLRKLHDEGYDAIVLAAAGLNRLGIEVERDPLPTDAFIPAPGQGALGVQCRVVDGRVQELLRGVEHAMTRLCVRAERAFLAAVGGGCSVPAGALATIHRGELTLRAGLKVGGELRRVVVKGGAETCEDLGQEAAEALQG